MRFYICFLKKKIQKNNLLSLLLFGGCLSFCLIGCQMFSSSTEDQEKNGKNVEDNTPKNNFHETYELKREADRLLLQEHSLETCQQALENYQKAQSLDPEFPGLYWRMARACHYLSSYFEKGNRERKKWAKMGLEYAQNALKEANDAQANYYYALFTGIVADETFAPDPKVVLEIVAHAQTSSKLDPTFDYAGAYRLLGSIYLSAPPFPRSIGDKEKAVEFLKRALEENSEYQENYLLLGEALFLWAQVLSEEEDFAEEAKNTLQSAKKALKTALEITPLPDRAHLKVKFETKARELLSTIEENH